MSMVFLLDPIEDTNGLGLYSRPFGPTDLILIGAFAVTILVLAFAASEKTGWPLWVFATGVAIHSFSETYALVGTIPIYFGNLAVTLPNAASFLLHKSLEGFVIVSYGANLGIQRLKDYFRGAIPIAVFSIAGGVSALVSQSDLTPLLAAAAGGWLFILVALGLGFSGQNKPKIGALVVVGFVIVYSTGLLHSF